MLLTKEQQLPANTKRHKEGMHEKGGHDSWCLAIQEHHSKMAPGSSLSQLTKIVMSTLKGLEILHSSSPGGLSRCVKTPTKWAIKMGLFTYWHFYSLDIVQVKNLGSCTEEISCHKMRLWAVVELRGRLYPWHSWGPGFNFQHQKKINTLEMQKCKVYIVRFEWARHTSLVEKWGANLCTSLFH